MSGLNVLSFAVFLAEQTTTTKAAAVGSEAAWYSNPFWWIGLATVIANVLLVIYAHKQAKNANKSAGIAERQKDAVETIAEELKPKAILAARQVMRLERRGEKFVGKNPRGGLYEFNPTNLHDQEQSFPAGVIDNAGDWAVELAKPAVILANGEDELPDVIDVKTTWYRIKKPTDARGWETLDKSEDTVLHKGHTVLVEPILRNDNNASIPTFDRVIVRIPCSPPLADGKDTFDLVVPVRKD